MEHGILDYFMFYGPQISDCVSTFASLVGKPAMVPKYALGYLASSMGVRIHVLFNLHSMQNLSLRRK